MYYNVHADGNMLLIYCVWFVSFEFRASTQLYSPPINNIQIKLLMDGLKWLFLLRFTFVFVSFGDTQDTVSAHTISNCERDGVTTTVSNFNFAFHLIEDWEFDSSTTNSVFNCLVDIQSFSFPSK